MSYAAFGGGGGGGSSTATRGVGLTADGNYAMAKTSVWWDIENCQVPKDCDAHLVAKNISAALAAMGYKGPVSISAYGDTTLINASVLQALSSTGVSLNYVPGGVKDGSDKKILVGMLFWAIDNPPPANYLLISGDRDFSSALHQLSLRRYNILLAMPPNVSQALSTAAKTVWYWTDIVAGGFPLSLSSFANENGASSEVSRSNPIKIINPLDPLSSNSNPACQKTYANEKIDNQNKGPQQPLAGQKQPNKRTSFLSTEPSPTIIPGISQKNNKGNNGSRNLSSSSASVQSLTDIILYVLTVLRVEKISPTEANISDCIRYGELNIQDFDVRKALNISLQYEFVVKFKLGGNVLYNKKGNALWKCVNVMDSHLQHSKAVLRFLSSADGHSSIMASRSMFEAAFILKQSCLKTTSLGEILQILNAAIHKKKWILPHSSSWQPLFLSATKPPDS